MKILILGIDGFIGFPLACHLAKNGYEVAGVDSFLRRRLVREVGEETVIPIKDMDTRLEAIKEVYGADVGFDEGDVTDGNFLYGTLKNHKPDTIVNLAQIPSAPFGQISRERAVQTQVNNVVGNLNLLWAMKDLKMDTPIIQIGTMGEYPVDVSVPIPEGFFEFDYMGKRSKVCPFPRYGGSYYHQSKIHASNNTMLACKLMENLKVTDINQGVVYGTQTDETVGDPRLRTRFDAYEVWGTCINRYCAQAVIGYPLTPFGETARQKRGFIALRDSIKCIRIMIDNPPEDGEWNRYRIINQFDQVYDVTELAERVRDAGRKMGLDVKIKNIPNPRLEPQEHTYEPIRDKLKQLGFRQTHGIQEELNIMLDDLLKHKDRIEAKRDRIAPRIMWRTGVKYEDES